MQILRTMIYLSILVSGCVIFLRLPLLSRAVPLLFMLIATVVLLLKEQLLLARIRRRAAAGKLRERVLLAGVPQDIAALENSLTPEESMRLNIADRIDIETRPISDLVEAMHEHAVAWVIFAAGHSKLNRVEEAIGACEVEGVPAWLVANFIRTSIAKPDFDAFGGRPMPGLSLNAGCVLGAAGETADGCVRVLFRHHGFRAADDRGRGRSEAHFAGAGDL